MLVKRSEIHDRLTLLIHSSQTIVADASYRQVAAGSVAKCSATWNQFDPIQFDIVECDWSRWRQLNGLMGRFQRRTICVCK